MVVTIRMKLLTMEAGRTELSSAQASVLFRNIGIRGGTSVFYFFNALNKRRVQKLVAFKKLPLIASGKIKKASASKIAKWILCLEKSFQGNYTTFF